MCSYTSINKAVPQVNSLNYLSDNISQNPFENSDISAIKINNNLNPVNAKEKGYQWVKDTIYTPSAPALFQEIVKLIKEGYCLGQSSLSGTSKVIAGLYKRI